MTDTAREVMREKAATSLKDEILALAREMGVDKAGFTSRERLQDAPPSGDLGYVLSGARSAVSLVAALDKPAIKAYLGKQDWMTHVNDMKDTYRKLKKAGMAIRELLRERGYEAELPYLNFDYRQGQPFASLVPPLSHRYVAVAAGIGWLGWSGNVITPEYGAPITLASVVTSAALEPDPLAEGGRECDNCRLCAATCASDFISPREETTVTIAGRTYRHNRKASNLRCDVTCGGANGAKGPHARWSTWSYHRLDLPGPGDDDAFEKAVMEQYKSNSNKMIKVLIDFENNQMHDWEQYDWIVDKILLTCGNCMLICWPEMADRKENYRLLATSGRVVKGESGPVVVKD
jgi:hypothetical protein